MDKDKIIERADKEALSDSKERVFLDFDGDDANVTAIQNVEPIAVQQWLKKKSLNDGWTEKRMFKHVGCIPEIFARQEKYKGLLSDDKLEFEKTAKLFFKDHPEFMGAKRF